MPRVARLHAKSKLQQELDDLRVRNGEKQSIPSSYFSHPCAESMK